MSNSPFGKPIYETTCRVCNREYESLGAHVSQAHGLSAHGYRVEFGLSMRHVLISADLAARRRLSLAGHLKELNESRSGSEDVKALFSRANAKKRNATHCAHGHPYDEKNLRWDGSRRSCRKCDVRRQIEYQRRRAAVRDAA